MKHFSIIKFLIISVLFLTLSQFYAFAYLENGRQKVDSTKVDSLIKYITLGNELLSNEKYDSAFFFLNRGNSYFKDLDTNLKTVYDNSYICVMYNSLGIYELIKENNFKYAVNNFLEGIKYAENNKNQDYIAILTYNLICTFFVKHDSTGLKYALDLYSSGKNRGHTLTEYYGAYCCAMMFLLKEDYENAENFINIAFQNENHNNDPFIHSLRANIMDALGEYDLANQYYQQAMNFTHTMSKTTAIYHCLSYGKFLLNHPQYGGASLAIKILNEGISIGNKSDNILHREDLYYNLHLAYSKTNEWELALRAYSKYHETYKFLYNIEKELETLELVTEYEMEQTLSELEQKELTIKTKTNQVWIFGLVLIILAIITVFLYRSYIQRNKMHLAIVKQYKAELEFKQKEKEIIERPKTIENYNTPTIVAETEDLLFSRLQNLLSTQKAYRDPEFNRTKACDLLQTNRTYLSTVLRENANMSFTQYINSLRIDDSIALLSDSTQEMSLKDISVTVGFNSINTFYRIFKDIVGMTPNEFRERLKELG